MYWIVYPQLMFTSVLLIWDCFRPHLALNGVTGILTLCPLMTHIYMCQCRKIGIGSINGLFLVLCQVINWIDVDMLAIWHWIKLQWNLQQGTNTFVKENMFENIMFKKVRYFLLGTVGYWKTPSLCMVFTISNRSFGLHDCDFASISLFDVMYLPVTACNGIRNV